MTTLHTHGMSLASTAAVAYVLCAIFDAVFAPAGLLGLFSQVSPWPLVGTPAGYAAGFTTFAIGGYVLGAIYGAAWQFWSRG